MPIRWDTLLARHTARELAGELTGARLRAIRVDRDRRDLLLLFKERTLVWRLHPSRGHPVLLDAVDPVPGDHRYRGTLAAVETPPDERLVHFRFSPGRDGPVGVVVELMSTQWNAIVTEGEAQTVRHLLWRSRADERRVIGQPYRLPAPTNRSGVDGDVSLADWLGTLEPLEPSKRRGTLVRGFAWTSPLNARALLGEDATPDTGPGEPLAAGHALWRALADPEQPSTPVVLELRSGPQPYPFPLPGTPSRGVSSLMAAFAECGKADEGSGDPTAGAVLGPDLLARLEHSVNRAARRLTSLEAQLSGLEDPASARAIGDLILARYHEIPPGTSRVTLIGFDGTSVDVELDPAEPAHANAARYYDRATKSERAADQLPRLLEKARVEVEELEDVARRVREGTAGEDEVIRTIGPAAPTPRGDRQTEALPYRPFRSSGGLEIRVGKGAKYNDDLTFRHSSPNDVWLHARHTAGAHVVLRWQGEGRPPARDLQEAATLAALHSKARTSGSVPVDWTLRKYVRKPRKSPPGQVAVERTETLFVEPDEALLEKLQD